MDSQHETTPLLAVQEPRRQARTSSTSKPILSRFWARYDSLPTVVRVTPSIFLSSLSVGLPALTIVEIMKRITCAIWYLENNPDELPGDGSPPDEKCQTPGPVVWFSAFMIVQALLMAFGGFIMVSLIAQYGTRVGRKPMLLLIVLGQFMAMASFVAAIFLRSDIGAFILLGIWLVTSSFCGPLPLIFTCNLMVVDTTDPADRTAALSFTMGATAAGGIPSYALGGLIYRAAGPRVLCLITLGVYSFNLLLASSSFVRETFGGSKLGAAREDRRERYRTARERSLERWISDEADSTRGRRRGVRKTVEAIYAVFDPILRLGPTTRVEGKLNFRLTFLAAVYLFAAVGTGYLESALISYMSVVLRYNPEQSGVIMTGISVFQTIGLAIVFPFVANKGRDLYTRTHLKKARHQKYYNGLSNRSVMEEQQISATEETGDTLENATSEISVAHFDVHLLRWCYFIFILLLLCVGYAKTTPQLMALASFLLLCSGAHPALQSVAAASVSPIQAGEAIAGIEMVGQIARFASPIVIGTIQSETILTMPMITFSAMAACVAVATGLTFLVRDEDRYIAPAVGPPTIQEGADDGR